MFTPTHTFLTESGGPVEKLMNATATAVQEGHFHGTVNTHLLDGGLVLYIGLLVLFVWRFLFSWRCCGRWLQYANYCSLLLLLLMTMMGYDLYMFIRAALSKSGKSQWEEMPSWLRPFILCAPAISVLTFCMASFQTFQHVEKIKDDSAVLRHDRAVQIILLPLVYCTTAMTSLSRLYKVIIAPEVEEEESQLQLLKAETCIMVGDLYEAWALYQFGKLTLELIESSIAKQGLSEREEERAAARALMVAHTAVESLAWVGILSFLVVCVLQSGWSLWILTFIPADTQVSAYAEASEQFTAAGFLASCAAIYNVFIVESTFHHFLAAYSPWLKFLTVKFLVSFAYCQRIFFDCCQIAQENYIPGLQYIPVIGEIIMFDDVKFELFYACLLIFECFIVSLMHLWAWRVSEEWYDEAEYDRSKIDTENRDILDRGSAAPSTSYGSFH
mmetsp:Transcript_18652/g.33351  ORF Transcript_18652/g.33351 Transcript_18652/m.33351 type:complete len:444 (-) Transcript_18652:114-1445(-)